MRRHPWTFGTLARASVRVGERAQLLAPVADGLVVIVMLPHFLCSAAILLASRPHQPSVAVVPLPGPIHAMAAADAGLVVVTGGSIRVLDPLGHPVRSIGWRQLDREGRSPAPARLAEAHATAHASVPGPTADSGWAISYDPDDIDRQDDPRLVDDALGAEPSRRSPAGRSTLESESARSPSVVATGEHAWIGRADGLWKIDLRTGAMSGLRRSRERGIHTLAVSPDGGTIAFIDAGELVLSRDGGTTFQPIVPVLGAVRALAITRTGVAFVLGTDGLRVIRPDAANTAPVSLGRASDVASCGQEVLVLANGILHAVVNPTTTTPVIKPIAAVPIGADGIICPATGIPWILRGSALWTSDDRGESWTERSNLPPSRISGVAVTTSTIWVATPSGLVALSTTVAPPHRPRSAEARNPWGSPLSASSGRVAIGTRSPPHQRWWQVALPRIDLSFAARQATTSATQMTTRREISAWIVATFTLDRPRHAPRRREDGLATPLATPLGPESRHVQPSGPDGPPNDPVTIEERQAMARILEERP